MILPQTMAYKLFKENTLIITDGFVWDIRDRKEDDNFFRWYTKIFGVVRRGHLRDFEEDYFEKHRDRIKSLRENFVNTDLKEEDLRLTDFVINKVIRRKERKKICKCVIEEILDKELFICEGIMYKMQRVRNENHEIRINKRSYSIDEKLNDAKKFENEYETRLRSRIINSAKITNEEEIAITTKRGRFYNKQENTGFEKTEKGFFIYTLVKPYALYEVSNKKYYGFDEAKVGIELKFRDDKIMWHDAVVMNKYMHPALPDYSTYQKICTGNFSYGTIREKYDDEAKQVRVALQEAKRMVERGYFSGKGSWNKLTEPKYRSLQLFDITGWRIANT